MKISKKIFAGMTALVLSFGLMVSGCATTHVDMQTETSIAIFEAASDLVAQEGGISAGAFISGLGDRFPGLRGAAILAIQTNMIQIVYDGRDFTIRCTMPEFVRDFDAAPTGTVL